MEVNVMFLEEIEVESVVTTICVYMTYFYYQNSI